MKTRDMILVALIATNAALAAVAGAYLLAQAETPAFAESQSRAGDYVIVTGPISSSREGMLVIDVVAQRANFYAPKPGTTGGGTQWELLAVRRLKEDFGAGR